jgi:hypothetical protein
MSIELKEWDVIGAEWREQNSPPTATGGAALELLRQRVRRHTRLQWLELAGEIALTIFFTVWGIALLDEPNGRGVVPAMSIFGMTAFVWVFAMWSRRGSWRPLSESAQEYVRLSRARVRAARYAVRFARGVILASMLLYVPWFAIRLREGAIQESEWWRWGFFAVYATAFLGWCSWRAGGIHRELELLGDVERELADSDV